MKRARIRFGPALALALSALMAASSVPALAQGDTDASPSPEDAGVPPTTPSGRPDLYLEMPYYMGGFEPQIVMVRGAEHFSALGPDDATRLAFEELLETVGAEVDDLVSGYALVSQEGFFAFVVAIRVDGVEPGTLWPAYRPILLDDLEEASTKEGSVGGKDVTIVTSIGDEGEFVELHAYDEGDTIWLLQGPYDVVEATLADLPSPLSAD